MKYRLFCLILLLAVLLASCGEQSHTESQEASAESSYGESSLGTVSEEQMPESLFEEAPYAFVFTSYGDGTCAITDVLTDPQCTEAFDLIIPSTSPRGDSVVEVDLNALHPTDETDLLHGVEYIAAVRLPNPFLTVHQGFLGLAYTLYDGSGVELTYGNPVSMEVLPYEEHDTAEISLDAGGNEALKFTFSRPVKEFHILSIDETESLAVERHPDSENRDYKAGESVSYLLMLGETMSTRGFSFVGEDGVTYEYAILYDGAGFGEQPYYLRPVSELTGTVIDKPYEELLKVGEHLVLATLEEGTESLLYLNPDGTKTEIHRDSYLQEGFFAESPDGTRVLFNTYFWEAYADVYLYHLASGQKRKLEITEIPEEDTVAFMEWLDERYFLFVVQYSAGTIVRGGDLYVYDTVTDDYASLVEREDSHLQIRSFSLGEQTLILDTPLYDETWNETEDRSYEIPLETVYRLIAEGGKTTLTVSDRLLFAIETVENTAGKEFISATTGGMNDYYAIIPNQTVTDLWVCEFFAGAYYEYGWMYQISGARYVGEVPAATPVYVEAAYTDITHRFGVSCLDETGARRFFAVYYNGYDGSLMFEDITGFV